MTINATAKSVRLIANYDGTLDGAFPDGNKPLPPAGTDVIAKFVVAGWGVEGTGSGATTTFTGPVPLAVHFDGINSTESVTAINAVKFVALGAHFDFGETAGTLTWSHTQLLKVRQVGGLMAGHVYETAGTYTATMRVQDINGKFDDSKFVIIAVDADTYWTTGGRTTVTVTANTAVFPTMASNTRYIFEAGGNYTAMGTQTISGISTVCFDRYGAGANPVLPRIIVDSASATSRTFCSKLQFNNLNTSVFISMPTEYISFSKCSLRDAMYIGQGVETYLASQTNWYAPRYITFYDTNIPGGTITSQDDYCLYTPCVSRLQVLGGQLSSPDRFHNVRLSSFYKVFMAHCLVGPGSAGNQAGTMITPRSQSTLTFAETYAGDWASQYCLLSDLVVGTTADNFNTDACADIKPPNGTVAAVLSDVVVERMNNNRVTGGNIRMAGQRLCVRDTSDVPAVVAYSISSFNLSPGTYGPFYSNHSGWVPDGTYKFAAGSSILPSKAFT